MTDVAEQQKRIQNRLQQSLLFATLSDEILAEVATLGNVVQIANTEVVQPGSSSIGFVNLILSGSLRVERANATIYENVRDVGPGHPFGGFDPVLGFGTFLRATALSDSTILALPREPFRSLVNNRPELGRHLAHLREVVFMRTEEKRSLDAQPSEDKSYSSRRPGTSRIPLDKKAFSVQWDRHEAIPLRNIDQRGFFAIGKSPGPPETIVELTLATTLAEIDPIVVKARVVRVQDDGFGGVFIGVKSSSKVPWQNLQTILLSQEAREAFEISAPEDSIPTLQPITTPDDPEKNPTRGEKTVTVRDATHLRQILFSELSQGILSVDSDIRYLAKKIDDPISVELHLPDDPNLRAIRDRVRILHGTVSRIDADSIIVALDRSSLPQIATIKEIISQSAQQTFQRKFHRQLAVDHNRSNRRYIQGTLIVLLLAAALWWAKHHI